MSRIRFWLAVLVVFGLCIGTAVAGEPVVLKFASIEPPQSFNSTEIFIPWVDKINKEGEGIIKIQLFLGGTLGRNPNDQLKILLNGVSDLNHLINAYHQASRFGDEQVTQTPFLARDCVECAQAVGYMQEKKVVQGYDDLVILGQICLGVYGIHTDFPVKVPADLKGTKMRTAGKLYQGLSKALGTAPVDMPVTKVAEAMSRGVVQATMQDWLGMEVFRIADVARYHLLVPLGTNLLTVAMTKKKYDSLPDEAKAILDKHIGKPFSKEWSEKLSEKLQAIQDKYVKDPNHHVYTPNAAEMKQWQDVFAPVVASWGDQIDRWNLLLDTYEEGLEKARANR